MMLKLLPLTNQGANGVMTCDLKNLMGYTIDRLILQLGGTFTKAQITALQVKANAKIIFDDSGSNIDSRMKYRGIFDDARFLVIDFSEIRSKTIVGQLLGALDTTFGIGQLSLEVTVAGATTPTLTGWAEVSAPQVSGSGQHVPEAALIGKVLRYMHQFSAGGSQLPFYIPSGKQGGANVKRLHFFHSGALTGVMVKKNGLIIHESIAALNVFNLKEYTRVPQSNVYTLDFVKDGNQSNVLNTRDAQSFEIYGTLSDADQVTVVAETLDPLSNN